MLRPDDDCRFWDGVARKYATDPIKDLPGYERTLQRIQQLMRSSDTWFEIGCGTGMTARRLACSTRRLVATDPSAEMIAIAREKLAEDGCSNVTFEVGTMPPSGAGFDGALALNVLHLLRDRSMTLALVHEMLKPGALFVSKTPCLAEMSPLIRVAVPIARLFGKAPTVSFFDAAQLEREVVSAGFTIVERARHGSTHKDPRLILVAQK